MPSPTAGSMISKLWTLLPKWWFDFLPDTIPIYYLPSYKYPPLRNWSQPAANRGWWNTIQSPRFLHLLWNWGWGSTSTESECFFVRCWSWWLAWFIYSTRWSSLFQDMAWKWIELQARGRVRKCTTDMFWGILTDYNIEIATKDVVLSPIQLIQLIKSNSNIVHFQTSAGLALYPSIIFNCVRRLPTQILTELSRKQWHLVSSTRKLGSNPRIKILTCPCMK